MGERSRSDMMREMRKSIKRSQKLSDGAHACIDNKDIVGNAFKIINRIGSGSVNGEAFKTCHPIQCDQDGCECTENPDYLAVKKIPLSKEDYSYADDPTGPQAMRSELWAELLVMKLCDALVDNNVTPNVPVYVNYFICDSCSYVNEDLQQERGGEPCVILINELATAGDISKWSEIPRTDDEWINAYFQIFSALYALQKYFDITHHDLHWGNVLVHEVERGGFWRYTIDGKVYDVPNMGWLFTLWDFGYARIPGKIEIDKWRNMTRYATDGKTIETYDYYESDLQLPRHLVDYRRITNVPVWRSNQIKISRPIRDFVNNVEMMFQQGVPLQSLISTWLELYPASLSHDSEIIEEFSFDKPLQMERKLYRFMRQTVMEATRRPTRSQVAAQQKLREELKYDANIIARKKMENFMRTYQKPRPPVYNPRWRKNYKHGDIVEIGNKVVQAQRNSPRAKDWKTIKNLDDFDVEMEDN